MHLMLALLYFSGDAMKKEVGFIFVIFAATKLGICIESYARGLYGGLHKTHNPREQVK